MVAVMSMPKAKDGQGGLKSVLVGIMDRSMQTCEKQIRENGGHEGFTPPNH